MNKAAFAVKIDPTIIRKIRSFCLERGIKQSFFVEKALKDELANEEMREDLLDFKGLRSSEKDAISFEEYLKGRQ